MFVKYSSVFLLVPVTLASEMSRGWMLDQSIGINVGVAFHKVKEIKDVQSEEEKKESKEEKKRKLEEEIAQYEREKAQAEDEKRQAEQDRAQRIAQLQLPGNLQGELANANTAYRNADMDAEEKSKVHDDVYRAAVICNQGAINIPLQQPNQLPVTLRVRTTIGEVAREVVGLCELVQYHGMQVNLGLANALGARLDALEARMVDVDKVRGHYPIWAPGDEALAASVRNSFRALRQGLPTAVGQIFNPQLALNARNAAVGYLSSLTAEDSLYSGMSGAFVDSRNKANQARVVRATCARNLAGVMSRLREAQQLAPAVSRELGALDGKIRELVNKIDGLRERSSGAERRESAAADKLLRLRSKLGELEEELSRRREGTPEEEVPAAPIASNIPVSKRKAKPVAEIEYALACRNSKLLIGANVIVGGMIGKVEQCSGFYYVAMPKVGLMLTKDVGLYVAAGIRHGKKTSPIVGAGIRYDISPKMYAKLEFNRWWTSRVRANVIKVGFGFRF